jgi:hypothetical protein
MAFAEQGRQAGWDHQAANMVTPQNVPATPDITATTATALTIAADRNATPLDRRKALRLVGDGSAVIWRKPLRRDLPMNLTSPAPTSGAKGSSPGPAQPRPRRLR